MVANGKENSEKLTIGFDAKRALFNTSGLGNYSRNLLNELAEYYPDNSYILFTPQTESMMALKHDKFRIVSPGDAFFRFFNSLWRAKFITNDIKREKPDIYHGLSHELPYGIEKCGVKSVVTVHDLIFIRYPELYRWADTKIYTRKLIHACRVADRVVAISNQTRDDLVKILGVPTEKISVIYQGCNPIFRINPPEEEQKRVTGKFSLPERYLLYVGTVEERKNLLGILTAIHSGNIEIPLVVVGRKVKSYFRKVNDFIEKNSMKNIIFLEGIANTDLPVIYRKAECFVYPSFVEGFGIPLVEALVSGTPVITTEGGCFPEAAGPGSLYIDAHNPDLIGDAIIKVVSDNTLKDKMIKTGLEYSDRFRDERIAEDYMNLYRSL